MVKNERIVIYCTENFKELVLMEALKRKMSVTDYGESIIKADLLNV